MDKKFWHAVAALIGMIIGVGIFGIPYAVERVGLVAGICYILALGGILLFLHLIYGEVVLRTQGKHRLVGYAGIYLGSKGKAIASIVQIFSFYGALIAYIIIGGQFLQVLLSPYLGGGQLIYQTIFFVVFALMVLAGMKLVARAEFLMTILLLAVMGVILILGAPHVQVSNMTLLNLKEIFFPYGVILFALGGAAAIPQIKEILARGEKKMKSAIVWGTIIPIIMTALFAFVVVGVSGANTSPEAISGLLGPLGEKIVFLGAMFGFLAIATSFLVLGLNLQDIFQCDFKFNRFLSWLLACVIPFLIFLWSKPDFITIIGITGALFGGFEGLIIMLIWLKAKKEGKRKPEYNMKTSYVVVALLATIFVLGFIHKIIYPGA